MLRKTLSLGALLVLPLVALIAINWQQDQKHTAALVERGHAIAEQTCLRCHREFESDPVRNPAAPALATFGQRWPLEDMQEALAEGITVSHENTDMPEFSFSPETINELLAYFADLTKRAKDHAASQN